MKRLPKTEIGSFRTARSRSDLSSVIAHASYLINLSSGDRNLLGKSRHALLQQLKRCDRLGIDALIVHPGSHRGLGETAGVERVAESLEWISDRFRSRQCRLLLENTAGQGDLLGSTLEELARILELTRRRDGLGLCLDTCHAFAAGYAVHRVRGLTDFLRQVDKTVGLELVHCLHLNDSQAQVGTRIDRHANIGHGRIGTAAFGRILRAPQLQKIPMILETPTGEDGGGHARDLELLRSLRYSHKG